jgi:hypothetical protein
MQSFMSCYVRERSVHLHQEVMGAFKNKIFYRYSFEFVPCAPSDCIVNIGLKNGAGYVLHLVK